MKCSKCNTKNPDGSKFCSSCGESLLEKRVFEHQDLYDKVTTHLEFIGYDIGKPVEGDDGKYLRVLAINKNRSNLNITFNLSGMMVFVSWYTIDKDKVDKKREEALTAINKMNLSSLVCSFSLSEKGDSITISSWYPGEYSKKLFSDFLETYEADIKSGFNSSGILDFS